MLEAKDLCKVYRPKKGVPVTALDHVSIRFPQKGLVFLLGKSGSGKSTLLNVLGGLDRYDDGEIVIKGVSSKDFRQQHFDSYRNTYVGFIFQEYNVLEDFNVGANIALAIELQNRRATDEQINAILKEVDLDGYGSRKPNELSGGQKQRVAIARALVKSPDIIMADEPTGALDSNTGKQVLDTLKKLSAEKLVIVVSHDRDFAERYADRIIELSDGKVIRDVERDVSAAPEKADEIIFSENTVQLPAGYHLTEEDRERINEYVDRVREGVSLEIGSASAVQSFRPTDTDRIPDDTGAKFRLIKSKLPLHNAFRIGAGGLKHKKFRLVITILLSCIAFGLFGLSDTFGAYNHVRTCTNSLYDTKINYATVVKAKRTGKGDSAYWRDYGYSLDENDLAEIEKNTGVAMHGMYLPKNTDLDFAQQIDPEVRLTETDYNIYSTGLNGYVEIDEKTLRDLNCELVAGRLPDGTKNEAAVSEYVFEVFKKAGYSDGTTKKNAKGEEVPVYQPVSSYVDLIGKKLTLGGKEMTVTGIVDTKFDLSRYEKLAVAKKHPSKTDDLINFALYSEFNCAIGYSVTGAVMVGDGYVRNLIATSPAIYPITNGYICFSSDNVSVDSNFITSFDAVKDQKIIWLDGERKTLGEKEILATSDALNFFKEDVYDENGETDYKKNLNPKEKMFLSGYSFDSDDDVSDEDYRLVGVIPINEKNAAFSSTVVTGDGLFQTYTKDGTGPYWSAVGQMPEEREELNKLVSYCYAEDADIRYQMQNSVTFELDGLNNILKELSKYFLYIGIGFALFAALMLANFIGTSISYKKQDIGILRAIGSRSNDVFRIFFSESFIIAMINFVLSAVGVAAVTFVINYYIRAEIGILITVLSFGLRQILLLLGASLLVAFLASFIPVKRIASKRPIDAIRNK